MDSRRLLSVSVALIGALLLWLLLTPSTPTPEMDPLPRPAREPVAPQNPAPSRSITSTPAPTPPDQRDLPGFLLRLGRAIVTRDTRSVERLKKDAPDFYRTDIDWLLTQLRAELMTAVGSAEMLLHFGIREAVAPLVQRLRSDVSTIFKTELIRILALFRGDAAESALAEAMRTEREPLLRILAAEGLASFGDTMALQALLQTLSSDPHREVRSAAARALARFPSMDVVAPLLDALRREPEGDVRAAVIRAAYESGGESILPQLREIIQSDPAMMGVLLEEEKRRDDSRYAARFPPGFFLPGSTAAIWDPSRMDRIGITMDLRKAGSLTLSQAATLLFGQAPLDAYRTLFYLRNAVLLEEDLSKGVASPRAWDAFGAPIPGGLQTGRLEGTVFIQFHDPAEFGPRIEGYTEGPEAHVTRVSLFHEFGHAFAQLGDEYDSPDASDAGGVNLDARDPPHPKWQPLVDQGHLEAGEILRGTKRIPSLNCYMNNKPTDARWCPVCQLEIRARISERTGSPLPW